MTPKPLQTFSLKSSIKPYYWKVFLWATLDDMQSAWPKEFAGSFQRRGDNQTLAFCAADWEESHTKKALPPRRRMGELHFTSGEWDIGVVAHEVTHAILHRMRFFAPGAATVLVPELDPGYDADHEEEIAYEHGYWTNDIVVWLAEHDPRSPLKLRKSHR